MLITIGLTKPFKDKKKWKFELMNESVIMVTVYFVMCFSDYVPNINPKIKIGYAFCGFLCAHTFMMISNIAIKSIRD